MNVPLSMLAAGLFGYIAGLALSKKDEWLRGARPRRDYWRDWRRSNGLFRVFWNPSRS